MSAAKLLVLGAVIEHGSAHGYQVRKDVESWRADLWGGIGQGSIYHALRRLTAEGLLAHAGEETPAAAPARTMYRATSEGRRAFVELLERMLASDSCTPGETMAAIGFLTTLTRQRALEILGRRVAAYRSKRDRIAKEYERSPDAEWGHHIEAVRFWIRSADAEVDFTTDLIDRLRSGEYVMAGD
ncbi:helix-turn-helix transcriptional regulator [Spiractinospora alimapuensis]|uniref:PadR family transcriptional regulator n=1 Tax=Spiractinospora alimapuensis TaxID=2820884 RepID=UPI001F427CC5|nr:helix-turn-helix transcriptional regulator [Spiractinospora alimapuensis]QVQ51494.1 helix-turn-helix transcriptional regulator [Spiractinospora alimapuensis]